MNSIIDCILSNDLNERKKALDRIKVERPRELKDELLQIVYEGPTYAKLSALKGYGFVITIDEIDSMVEFTKSKDWHLRLEALNSIVNLKGSDSIELLKPFLKDKAFGVRSEVEILINKLQSENK